MNLKSLNPKLVQLIKIVSTILISNAIGLELWNLYAVFSHQVIPSFIQILVVIAHLALLSHFIEGIIAGFYVFPRGGNYIKDGIYTFFTGTVGLLELWESDNKIMEE
ncbi:MAG: hypothetical protein RLZZ338_3819 [Cyanobacteriota bacterium]|jgi:flagellar biosynthesis protein FliR